MSTENRLSHVDAQGAARMVDVGPKTPTQRIALAEGRITMNEAAITAIRDDKVAKGDVLATARIAGIMAAKKTAELIPLCHPLPINAATIDFDFSDRSISVRASVSTDAKTGVEMEAMTAASVALLTIYDMAKALDKAMVVDSVRLLSKKGGKSGDWTAPESG